MKAYLDTSVVLARLFGEPISFPAWAKLEAGYASRLLIVEARRAMDRVHRERRLDDEGVASMTQRLAEVARSLHLVDLDERVLERAAGPMPTHVATLDALHLATAIELRAVVPALVFATHDLQLGRAARASGFVVVGAGEARAVP